MCDTGNIAETNERNVKPEEQPMSGDFCVSESAIYAGVSKICRENSTLKTDIALQDKEIDDAHHNLVKADNERLQKMHEKMAGLEDQQKRQRKQLKEKHQAALMKERGELLREQEIEKSKIKKLVDEEHEDRLVFLREKRRWREEGRENMEAMLKDGEKRKMQLLQRLPLDRGM